jgi:PAS domain S-box-containing protein
LLPDRVFRVNRHGDNLDFKGTEEDLERGLRREDVIGSNVRQWVEPDVAESILAAIARALETGVQQTVEYQVPIPWEPNKGELRDYETRLVVCGENEVLAIERDITDLKRSEAALRQSQERNSALLNAIPDLMFRIRQDGTYLDARADQVSDLAISPQDMIGRTVYEILPPAVAQQRMHYLKLALETGQPQLFEYQFLVRGEWRDYEARMVVSGADEVLTIMRDITERKRAERQLKSSLARQSELYQQLQRLNANLEQQVEERTAQLQQNMQEIQALSILKDEFLHAVSHDLRTPIMGMRLVLQNLQNKATDSITLSRSVLDRMVHSLDRQLAMLNSLLETHSSDLRGVSLQPEWLHLEELIQTIAIDLEPLLLHHQANLEPQTLAPLPRIWADSGQIRRVFENLITNALQHNPPGLKITLQATLEDGVIRCQVQDNGVGMKPEECDSMFDRYVRGSRSRRSPGIGLGLYLCKQIVMAHGGAIGVNSQPGAGATFWFTLPLTMEARSQESEVEMKESGRSRDRKET